MAQDWIQESCIFSKKSDEWDLPTCMGYKSLLSETLRFYRPVAFFWRRCFFFGGRLGRDHGSELIPNHSAAMFRYLEICRSEWLLYIFRYESSSRTDICITYPISLNSPYTLTISWNWITVPSSIWVVHWETFLIVQHIQIVPNKGYSLQP